MTLHTSDGMLKTDNQYVCTVYHTVCILQWISLIQIWRVKIGNNGESVLLMNVTRHASYL